MQGKTAWMAEPLAPQSAERPPNVVILLCDDLGKYEVSAYGAEHIQTPNMDRLGQSGVIFQEGYVTSPTCAPSRAGMMTGRVQNRFGFESQMIEFYPSNIVQYLGGKHLVDLDNWVLDSKPQYPSDEQRQRQGIPPSEVTLAEALKKHGYQTGLVGKWHQGISPEHLPLERGFDFQYGFYGSFSLYAPENEWDGVVNHVGDEYAVRYQWKRGRQGEGAIMKMGEAIREERYLTFAIRDEAVAYMERNQEDPFFLLCSFSAPHVPFQAPEEHFNRFAHVQDKNKRVYYAMISALDDAIGSIHQRITDLGLADNTIIYLLSDNGGATYTGATDNGPLKGGKLTQFEGGVNVPFMVSWPGHVPAGVRYEEPVSATDVFATSLALAGVTPPNDRPYDGVNLLPYLRGEMGDEHPHDQLFWRCDHIWALRDGDYKLILSTRDGWAELYDLNKDKAETIDLAEEMPELLAKLRQLHEQWQADALPEKPMWPRLVDHRFFLDGQEYLFPS